MKKFESIGELIDFLAANFTRSVLGGGRWTGAKYFSRDIVCDVSASWVGGPDFPVYNVHLAVRRGDVNLEVHSLTGKEEIEAVLETLRREAQAEQDRVDIAAEFGVPLT